MTDQPNVSPDPEQRRSTMDRRQHVDKEWIGPERRKNVVERRLGLDEEPAANDDSTGLEQNRGPGKRLQQHARAADKGEMTHEQFLFLMAIDTFKKVNQKSFPTWTDVLEVVRKLGYRKTQPNTLRLPAVEDWTESPDAVAFVEEEALDDED